MSLLLRSAIFPTDGQSGRWNLSELTLRTYVTWSAEGWMEDDPPVAAASYERRLSPVR